MSKGLLALGGSSVLLGVSAALLLTRRGLGPVLLGVGIGCFGIMALTHVFEAFSIFPWLQWGRPDSLGHFIDLMAAVLGVALVATSLLLSRLARRRGNPDAS
jgi:hypothetical protein